MMRKSGRKASKSTGESAALERIIEHLIATADPSRLFEFYYWSQEPDLLKIIRACASLPEAQRRMIASFFATMDGGELVSASWKEDGQLVLRCQGGHQRSQSDVSSFDIEPKGRAHRR